MRVRSVAALVGLYVLMLGAAAAGQASQREAPEQAARELGRRGLEAVASGDFWSAEERLSQAIALHDAPRWRLGRARARRGLGRLMSAADDYQAVLHASSQAGRLAAASDERAQAQSELAALEPSIPFLRIELVGGDAIIKVGGVHWPAAALARPQPIDPGDYRIEALLASGEVLAQSVTIDPGRVESVRFDLTLRASNVGRASAADAARLGQPAGAAGGPSVKSAPASGGRDDAGAGQRMAAYVIGAAALGTAIAATITAIVAVHRHEAFDAANVDAKASLGQRDALRSSTRSMQWISTGLTGVALGASAVSVYLLLSAPDDGQAEHDRARAHAAAWHPALGAQARVQF